MIIKTLGRFGGQGLTNDQVKQNMHENHETSSLPQIMNNSHNLTVLPPLLPTPLGHNKQVTGQNM